MGNSIDEARKVAISALNECHTQHHNKGIYNCNFCTSLANEMIIARNIEPLVKENEHRAEVINERDGTIKQLQKRIRTLEKDINLMETALQRVADYNKRLELMNERLNK